MKYYKSSLSERVTNPTDAYYDDFVAISDFLFDNAPNVVYNEIEYEEHYGCRDFKKIPRVRIDNVVNYNTGIQVGADYRIFIFEPTFPVEPYYGMKFKWGKNYYLVTNVGGEGGSLSKSAEVRRCNNTLRFFDENGNKIYEPCILDQVLRFTNNNDTMTIVTGKAEQYIWCQRNNRTKKIKPNDRFLFGTPEQRIGFRIYAGGFGNSLNTITGDDNSPSITQFYAEEYEINYEKDDVIGGFANAERFDYKIDISENVKSLDVGAKYKLNATVYKGNNIIKEDVLWTSADESIINIECGEMTALSAGTTKICATMKDNRRVYSEMFITVQEEDINYQYDILISPDINYVLEDESLEVNVSLYKNGVKQDDIIEIKDVSLDVPRKNYKLTVNGNSFTLQNKMKYLNCPVKVQCSCNEITKVFNFTLRGLY